MLSIRWLFCSRMALTAEEDGEPELDFGHVHFIEEHDGPEAQPLSHEITAEAEQPGVELDLEELPDGDAAGTSAEPSHGFFLDDVQSDHKQSRDQSQSSAADSADALSAPETLPDVEEERDSGDHLEPDFEMTVAGSDLLVEQRVDQDAAPNPEGSNEALVAESSVNEGRDLSGSSEGMVHGDKPSSLSDGFEATQPLGHLGLLDQLSAPEFSPGPSLQEEQAADSLKLQSNPGLDPGSRSTGSSSSAQFQGEFQGFGMESQGGANELAGTALGLEIEEESEGDRESLDEEEEVFDGGGAEAEDDGAGEEFRLTRGDSFGVARGLTLTTGGRTSAGLGAGEPFAPAGIEINFDHLGVNSPPPAKPPLPVLGNSGALYIRAGKWVMTLVSVSLMTAVVSVLAVPYIFSEEEMRLLARELSLEDTFEAAGLLRPEVSVTMPQFEELPVASVDPVSIAPVLVPSPNEGYFNKIIGHISSGEVYEAVDAMKNPPKVALRMRYDLDMSSMVAARLNLLLAQSEKAEQALHHRCVTHVIELSAEICIHYVRALVGLGRYEEARTLLARLKESRDHDLVADELNTTGRLLAAVEPRTPASLVQYILDFISGQSHDYEWDRQESLWILKEIGNLDVSRWRDLAQIVFQIRRSEIVDLLQSAEFAKEKVKTAMGLTWFLDFLAVRYGFESLGFDHGNRFLPASDHRFAAVARVLTSSFQGGSEVDQHLLHRIRSKPLYSELERLITINVSLQDRQLGKVYHLMNTHMDLTMRGQFGFEWKLLGAHYASEIGNKSMAAKLYRTFKELAKGDKEYVQSFDFWYTMSKLAAFHDEDPLRHVDRAQPFAFTVREQGLLEAVRIAWFAKNRQFEKLNVSLSVKKYPWHYRVLSAAILAQGHAGRDPKNFIEMQNRVSSSRIAEAREKNLLTDYTIRAIIQKI